MALTPEMLEALKPREERVQIGGVTLIVREISAGAYEDLLQDARARAKAGDERALAEDLTYKYLVACVFTEAGDPAFSTADIVALKRSSRSRTHPLLAALTRLNGFAEKAAASE